MMHGNIVLNSRSFPVCLASACGIFAQLFLISCVVLKCLLMPQQGHIANALAEF